MARPVERAEFIARELRKVETEFEIGQSENKPREHLVRAADTVDLAQCAQDAFLADLGGRLPAVDLARGVHAHHTRPH
jgi:hypothetical protein